MALRVPLGLAAAAVSLAATFVFVLLAGAFV